MRKIVSQGLNTVMEGMFTGPEITGNAEVREPLKQDKPISLYRLYTDENGRKQVACRRKFVTAYRIILLGKHRQIAPLSETHKSGLHS